MLNILNLNTINKQDKIYKKLLQQKNKIPLKTNIVKIKIYLGPLSKIKIHSINLIAMKKI